MLSTQKVVIAPVWQRLLRTHRLESVDEVYALRDGVVLKPGIHTEVRRIELADGNQKRALYIKKYSYPTLALLWSGFYRGTFLGRSKVRREFENLAQLRAWGLDAPAPVAYGEDRCARALVRSFLISEEIPDAIPLDLYLSDHLVTSPTDQQRQARRQLILNLADYVRRLHEHHFVHYDLYWRNILLSRRELTRFYLIDSHKGRCWPASAALGSRAQDLATLDAPAPKFFRRTERLRFFLRYVRRAPLTPADKELLRLILRRAEPEREKQLQRIRNARATL